MNDDRQFVKDNLIKRQGTMRTVIVVLGVVIFFGLVLGIDVLMRG